jgi:hypothetical protein
MLADCADQIAERCERNDAAVLGMCVDGKGEGTMSERSKEAKRMAQDLGCNSICEALQKAKGMQSALKVIHTLASFPESFDLDQTKRLCMSALGREQ